MSPKRIQRKRTKGWRMPEGAVYVGRGSIWGNPLLVGQAYTLAEAVALFEAHCIPEPGLKEKLRGHDLACWCPLDQPCHADVLLRWANQ